MSSNTHWAPLRWPAFPAPPRENEQAKIPAPDRSRWLDPKSLDILHGTPVNCLLVDWSAATRTQFEPAGAAAGWLRAARQRNLAIFGDVSDDSDAAQAAAAAAKVGLTAIFSKTVLTKAAVAVYPRLSVEEGSRGGQAKLALLPDLRWPGVRVFEGAGRADAGPTGKPWVDANSWYLKLMQALSPGVRFWVQAEPELDAKAQLPIRAERYQLAIADAAAYGGDWVVSLDARFADALASQSGDAGTRWRKVCQAWEFFRQRAAWGSYEEPPVLGIISDFQEPNLLVKEDTPNLCTREQLPYAIIPVSRKPEALPAGLKSVIYLMDEPPEDPWKQRLLEFAAQGGLLIAGSWWKSNPPGEPHTTARFPRYEMRTYGKGRIAIAEEEWSDPFLVAIDAHVMTSYRHDPFRLWNAGSLNVRYQVTPDNGRLVQMLNYAATEPAHEVTLAVRDQVTSATLTTIESGSRPIEFERVATGVEFRLPPLPVYAALELKLERGTKV